MKKRKRVKKKNLGDVGLTGGSGMAGLTGRSEDGQGGRASFNRPGLQHQKGSYKKWDGVRTKKQEEEEEEEKKKESQWIQPALNRTPADRVVE